MSEVYSYEQESRLAVAKKKLKSRCPLCEHLVFIPREKTKQYVSIVGLWFIEMKKKGLKKF